MKQYSLKQTLLLWCVFSMKWLADESTLSLVFIRNHFLPMFFFMEIEHWWCTRQEVEPSKGKNHLYSSLQLFPGNTEILIWSYASEILLDQLFYFRVLTFDWTFNCTLIADVMSHAFNLIWKSCEFEVESTFILVPQTHPLTK